MPQLPDEVYGAVIIAGLALIGIGVAAWCTVRGEKARELDAAIDMLLPEPESEQEEDFLSVWDDVLAMPDDEIAARLTELDATTKWEGLARHRRGVRRVLPNPQPFLPNQRLSEEDQ